MLSGFKLNMPAPRAVSAFQPILRQMKNIKGKRSPGLSAAAMRTRFFLWGKKIYCNIFSDFIIKKSIDKCI